MLVLSEILKEYPENIRGFQGFIIREYLQYKILQILFDSPFANEFSFLGGTCLRIVHGNTRFSEDLDFDNFQIPKEQFSKVSETITKELEKEGYEVEMRMVLKNAFHCIIKFPELLYSQGLSGHREEKILIQLDTEPQQFEFTPDKIILNKFDVFTQINCTPLDLLLAQKFYAILNRKRNKGRDFFDVVFLLSKIDVPNYNYLEQKLGIDNAMDLKDRILKHCACIDMEEMAKDVQPFLFNPRDVNKVRLFAEYMGHVQL
ncbi:MAG: nucleotidyl transferase AbiEii/AbiGii toxin family protein [Chitinophagaceae bacterium]